MTLCPPRRAYNLSDYDDNDCFFAHIDRKFMELIEREKGKCKEKAHNH